MSYVTPLAKRSECILAFRDAVGDLFRNTRRTGCNLFAGASDQACSPNIFGSLGSLGDQRFIFLAGKNCDFAPVSLLKSYFQAHLVVESKSISIGQSLSDENLSERELALEERLDAKIDKDLKQLGQMKTMKAIGLGKRMVSVNLPLKQIGGDLSWVEFEQSTQL